jgi:hypothetical protein
MCSLVRVGAEYCPGLPVCDPAARGEISNIHLDNVKVNGNGMKLIYSQLAGNSTEHSVDGVTIQNFVNDGRAVNSLAELNATTNEFVTGVKIL